MISFRNDYSEGAHPQVLAAREQNNHHDLRLQHG